MGLPRGLITNKTAHYPGDLKVRAKVATVATHEIYYEDIIYCVHRIIVPGKPVAKPRMTRRDKWAKRLCCVRYWEWCDSLRTYLLRGSIRMPAADTVSSLSWVAYFEPPKSWSKKKRIDAIGKLHRAKPDRDNIDKAVLDCLYPHGDSGIARGTIEKRWDWHARIEIEIRT